MTVSAASALRAPWNQSSPQALINTMANPALPPVDARFALSTDDPARGRVLVIEEDAAVALNLQRTLRDAGFLTLGPVTELCDIQRFIRRGPVDCAVLDLNANEHAPLAIADILDFLDVPFVLLAQEGQPIPKQYRRRPVVLKPVRGAALLDAVEEAISGRSRRGDPLDPKGTACWPPRVYPPL